MINTHCALVEVVARLLEPSEREVVLGDLLEAGENTWSGLLDIAGLAIRRQLTHWKSWRPWLAAFGLALPGSLLLMGTSVSVSLRFEHLVDGGISGSFSRAPQQDLLHLLSVSVLLIAASWACGFVMGTLSRRTLCESIVSSCIPCLFCLARFRESSLSSLCLFLFLIPAIWGVRHALQSIRINLAVATLLAISITSITMFPLNSGSLWTLKWALVWPAWYIVATGATSGLSRWTSRNDG